MSRYFVNNSYYFITVPTVNRFPFFDTPEKKQIVFKRLKRAMSQFYLDDFDYSIISNHYHFVAYFQNGQVIPKLLQLINGGSAHSFNKLTNNREPIWDEYYIYLIEDDLLLGKVRGYVIGNPMKHGEIRNFDELGKYPFSSYRSLAEKLGEETVRGLIKSVIVLNESEFLSKSTLTKLKIII